MDEVAEKPKGTKQCHSGSFKPGFDPRRNQKGRPKAFDFLRDLAQKIGAELLTDDRGEVTSRAEVILRKMADDPKQRQLFLEVAYGKVPQVTVLKGGGDGNDFIQVIVVHTRSDGATPLPNPPDDDPA
jgi:hypothetical protein